MSSTNKNKLVELKEKKNELCEILNKNNEFKQHGELFQIRMFSKNKTENNSKNIYYVSSDVLDILGEKSEEFNEVFDEFQDYELFGGYIKKNNRWIPTKFLTRHGLYKTILKSSSEIGELFWKFICTTLDTLFDTGQAKLIDVKNQVKEEYPKLLKSAEEEYKKNLKKLQKKLKNVEREKIQWEAKAELAEENYQGTVKDVEHEQVFNHDLQIENATLKEKVKKLEDYIDYLKDNNEIINRLHKIQTTLMQEMYVYMIVRKPIKRKQKKKTKQKKPAWCISESESSSEDVDIGLSEDDADMYNEISKPIIDNEYYYVLSMKKNLQLGNTKRLIDTLYVLDVNHYQRTKKEIDDSGKRPYIKVGRQKAYKISLDEIQTIVDRKL